MEGVKNVKLKIIAILIFLWGIADLVLSFLDFDLYSEIGINVPEWLWTWTAFIAIGLGAFIFTIGEDEDEDEDE